MDKEKLREMIRRKNGNAKAQNEENFDLHKGNPNSIFFQGNEDKKTVASNNQ